VQNSKQEAGRACAAPPLPPVPPPAPSPSLSPRTCYSLESGSTSAGGRNDFVLVLAPAGGCDSASTKALEEWAGCSSSNASSAATTAAGRAKSEYSSSEASSKATVVPRCLPESRSCTDLKDYFGERAATPTSMLRARSTSPDVRALADKFERRRSPSPIPPRKIRERDRFVSRVNVISKTAALQVFLALSGFFTQPPFYCANNDEIFLYNRD